MSAIENHNVNLKPASGLAPAEERLHALADLLANRNIELNIQLQSEQLQFLKDIDFKTAEDIEKVEEARKVLNILESEEYFNALRNTFTEHYAKMNPIYIERYLDEIAYENAFNEVGLTLTPALYKLRDDFVYGTVGKPTLQ